jgi:glutaminase
MCDNPKIEVNRRVYNSERKTGFRNRSLAWLLNDAGILSEVLQRQDVVINDAVVESILGVYFRLCSIDVTCDDLARFGAVLANDGCRLGSTERLVASRFVRIVTAMMSSTGLYDGSGEFAYRVGIPSKSGVSGGMLGTVPGRMGIAAYGPVIDSAGNSCRGQWLFERLSTEENLSSFNAETYQNPAEASPAKTLQETSRHGDLQ